MAAAAAISSRRRFGALVADLVAEAAARLASVDGTLCTETCCKREPAAALPAAAVSAAGGAAAASSTGNAAGDADL